MGELPAYDDLPPAPAGGRSAWGLFPSGDGLVDLQGPDQVRSAAGLVRSGKVFRLDASLDAFDPPLATGRGVLRRTVLHPPGGIAFDDVLDNYFPQASSQWDSLGHVGYGSDEFYDGATEAEVVAGSRNGIEGWARRGIVGRAVLLDMRAVCDYEPGTATAFGVDDLEAARAHAGVEYRPGDVILLHTGFAAWYTGLERDARRKFVRALEVPGIAHTEEVARYLWDSRASAIGSDNFSVEVWPPDFSAPAHPFGFLHRVLIGQFGMALGELWWLADLAADCAADGVYEMLFVGAPLVVPGGIGSPANATAIK